MKLLLSAFACEPGKGSEFEVGWNWTVALAELGHEVTVLTRSQSRPAIERNLETLPAGARIPRFAYFDVPPALRWESRGPLHLHYMIWQRGATRLARALHAQERFDCVHHITYAGLRAPSFMGTLGIPFIFGPVGGGETAPWPLRQGYSLRGLVLDAVRDLFNVAIRLQPYIAQTFARASKVYVTSPETLRLVPNAFHSKTVIELAIGSADADVQPPLPKKPSSCFRVLYAGRFVDYKGMHLGLPAFARLLAVRPDARLTMLGEGSSKEHWQRLAQNLGIADKITWQGWQHHDDMPAVYAEHDVLLFPGLHDSGGLVVLEAMNHGLPVVCLRLGGPGIVVDDESGIAVEAIGCSKAVVVAAMADALGRLSNAEARRTLADAARRRCRHFSWREKAERIYGLAS